MKDLERLRRLRDAASSPGPTSGIWYYVYYAPEWRLEVFRVSEVGNFGHPVAWNETVVPKLAAHYGLDARRRDLLKGEDLYRAMPRGRCDLSASEPGFIVAGEEPGFWYLFHGSDFPSGLDRRREEDRLARAFHLDALLARGIVEFRHAPHETTIEGAKGAIQGILGPVPY